MIISRQFTYTHIIHWDHLWKLQVNFIFKNSSSLNTAITIWDHTKQQANVADQSGGYIYMEIWKNVSEVVLQKVCFFMSLCVTTFVFEDWTKTYINSCNAYRIY